MSPAEPKSPPRRVLFLADCGPQTGGGHVMRCLSLARALLDRGAVCAMAATPATGRVLDAFAGEGLERLDVADLPPEALVEAVRAASEAWSADLAVVDHYRLEARHEQRLGAPVAVIDDLADRPHDCRLLVDPGFGRGAEDYTVLAPCGAAILTGPRYALLTPTYADARAALAIRRLAAPPGRLLVSLGLMDLAGVTGRVMGLLAPLLGDIEVDVVVGSQAPSLPALAALAAGGRRVRLHVDSREMPALIGGADIGVGAGGSSTWERAVLGLPSISLILADNQAAVAQELDQLGACIAVDGREGGLGAGLSEAFASLLADGALRQRLSETSAALCDGKGAARVAEAILALET